jgi:electron transport complex protein RnfE
METKTIDFVDQPRGAADEFLKGVWRDNPIFVQTLGMCPALAVTNTALNGVVMGLATAAVLACSNVLVSALREAIPKQVRIAAYVLMIATLVSGVDYALQAISLDVSQALGAFVALIVVNCQILGRAEAFASRHGVLRSLLDGLGTGSGFLLALLCLGGVRELLGRGTLFAVPVMPDGFQPWLVMLLPSGGFFVLGGWLLLFAWWKRRGAERA